MRAAFPWATRPARRRVRRPRRRGLVGAAPARGGPASRGGRRVTLAEAPLVVMLVGLIAYAVLGGADFGAGFWQLTPGHGEREQRDPRSRTPRDRARLGGEPRLADPRADGRLDVLPDGVRLDRLDARRAARDRRRSGSCCARPPTSLARPDGSSRASRPVESLFALSSIITPFALGAVVGAIASGHVPAGKRPGRSAHELAQPDVDRSSACSRSRSPRTSPPSGSRPTRRVSDGR